MEEFIKETLESPHNEYLEYKLIGIEALILPRKVWNIRIGALFKFDYPSSKPFNPFPQLDDFFGYMNKIKDLQPYLRTMIARLHSRKQEPVVDQNPRGTINSLGIEDVLAIYGRLYSIYDATTGCSPFAFVRRIFSPEARLKRSLPEISNMVDYVKQCALEDLISE